MNKPYDSNANTTTGPAKATPAVKDPSKDPAQVQKDAAKSNAYSPNGNKDEAKAPLQAAKGNDEDMNQPGRPS